MGTDKAGLTAAQAAKIEAKRAEKAAKAAAKAAAKKDKKKGQGLGVGCSEFRLRVQGASGSAGAGSSVGMDKAKDALDPFRVGEVSELLVVVGLWETYRRGEDLMILPGAQGTWLGSYCIRE